MVLSTGPAKQVTTPQPSSITAKEYAVWLECAYSTRSCIPPYRSVRRFSMHLFFWLTIQAFIVVRGFTFESQSSSSLHSSSPFRSILLPKPRQSKLSCDNCCCLLFAKKNDNPVIIIDRKSNAERQQQRHGNPQVRTFMSIFIGRYECDEDNINNSSLAWKKTRNYLYKSSDKLCLSQIHQVLEFLDERLPQHISKQVLQECPRILRKPVHSFLVPTADFLLGLWGAELFVQAIERNPALLLSSGVGYTTTRRKSSVQSNKSNGTNSQGNSGVVHYDSLDDYRNVESLLMDRTDMSEKSIQSMKRANPFFFGLPTSKIVLVMDFLESVLNEGLVGAKSRDDKICKILGKILFAHPHLVNLSVESNLRPRLEFLAASCQMNSTDVAKVVQISRGSVLGLSVEQNLKPTIGFLLREVFHVVDDEGDSDDGTIKNQEMLRKCLLSHPQILGLSLSNLKAKVNYFHSIGPSLALRIATKCPAIFSLSLEGNILLTVTFLQKIWGLQTIHQTVDFPYQQRDPHSHQGELSGLPSLAGMLQEYPNILTLSVEGNLKPTMVFFNKTGYTQLNENWELVSPAAGVLNNKLSDPSQPYIRGRYIAASLYNRLLPRWHYWFSKRHVVEPEISRKIAKDNTMVTSTSPTTDPLPKMPPLHILVMASDELFCKTMAFSFEDFLAFKEESIPRLKFSSQFDMWLKTGRPIDL